MTHIIQHARAKITDTFGISEDLQLFKVPAGLTYCLLANGRLLTDIFCPKAGIVTLWDSPLKASLGLVDMFGNTEYDLVVEITPGIWSLPASANLRWSRLGVAPAEFCGQPSLMKIQAGIEAELKATDPSAEVSLLEYPLKMIESSVSRHKGGALMQLRLEMFFDLAYRYGCLLGPEDRFEHLRVLLEEVVGLLPEERVEKLMSWKLYGCMLGPEHRLKKLRILLENVVGLLPEEQVEKLMSCDLIRRYLSQYFGFEE